MTDGLSARPRPVISFLIEPALVENFFSPDISNFLLASDRGRGRDNAEVVA